ncbi:MAG TPA: MFS transporter [Burkholderiales bacterium]
MLGAVFALNMFGRGLGDTYAVFLLPLEDEFGWSRSQTTGVYSVYLLVHGFTSPLVGLAFDRLGPRWVYGAGTACLGAAFFFAAQLTSLWQFYLLIGALVGAGVSLNGMVPASALLARWFRARLSTAIGVAYSSFGVGTLVLVPLAQHLVAELDWRGAYRAIGATLLLATPLVTLAVPWGRFTAGSAEHRLGRSARAGDGRWTLRTALRSPVYWGLTQVFFFTAAGMFAVLVQLVAFFIDAGFSPLAAATAYGATGMMSAISVTSSGFASERFGYRRVISLSFAGTAIGMLLLLAMAFHPHAWLLALFVPVFGLCMGVRGPIVSSVATKYFAGPSVAAIYGGIYAANAVGAAFGSFVGGLLHDLSGGYKLGFAFALACVAIASAPFSVVRDLRTYR